MLDSVMDQPFLTASIDANGGRETHLGTSRLGAFERYLNQFWWPGGFPFAPPPSPAPGTQGQDDGSRIEESKIWPALVLVVNYWNGS
jgi:hypothetical protein